LDSSTVIKRSFSNPHSNAFVDFNGDCAADLFITSSDGEKLYFEIWLRRPGGKFFLADVQEMKYDEVSVVSLGDMNNDGRIDLIFASIPEEANEPMKIHIIYNTIKSNSENPCTSTDMSSPFTKESYNTDKSIDVYFAGNSY